jgi:AmiR/NasT family two-component response regulator
LDSQRQISVDIHEASDELTRLTKIEAAARNLVAQKAGWAAVEAYEKLEEALKNGN